MREITIGFKLMVVCFPLREWDNWVWGRESGYLCLGPMRFRLTRLTAPRAD